MHLPTIRGRTYGLTVIIQKTLPGICPGKVFFCVKNFKKVLANTSYSMYNKDKDKGVIKRSTYHEQVWRIH